MHQLYTPMTETVFMVYAKQPKNSYWLHKEMNNIFNFDFILSTTFLLD